MMISSSMPFPSFRELLLFPQVQTACQNLSIENKTFHTREEGILR